MIGEITAGGRVVVLDIEMEVCGSFLSILVQEYGKAVDNKGALILRILNVPLGLAHLKSVSLFAYSKRVSYGLSNG
jgi:hypothetical protein